MNTLPFASVQEKTYPRLERRKLRRILNNKRKYQTLEQRERLTAYYKANLQDTYLENSDKLTCICPSGIFYGRRNWCENNPNVALITVKELKEFREKIKHNIKNTKVVQEAFNNLLKQKLGNKLKFTDSYAIAA